MAIKKSADVLRQEARERLAKDLAKVKAVELKENAELGAKLRAVAKKLGKSVDELLEQIAGGVPAISTISPQAKPNADKAKSVND